MAQSFLGGTRRLRTVKPIPGFEWGFCIDDEENVTLSAPVRLEAADWERHRPVLEQAYRGWTLEQIDRFD
jgi:hypothetical protein